MGFRDLGFELPGAWRTTPRVNVAYCTELGLKSLHRNLVTVKVTNSLNCVLVRDFVKVVCCRSPMKLHELLGFRLSVGSGVAFRALCL